MIILGESLRERQVPLAITRASVRLILWLSSNVPDVGFKSVSGEKLQRSCLCLNSRHVKDGDFKFLGSLIVITSACGGRISFLKCLMFQLSKLLSCGSVGMELGQVLNESQRKERFSHSLQQKRAHRQVLSWEKKLFVIQQLFPARCPRREDRPLSSQSRQVSRPRLQNWRRGRFSRSSWTEEERKTPQEVFAWIPVATKHFYKVRKRIIQSWKQKRVKWKSEKI